MKIFVANHTNESMLDSEWMPAGHTCRQVYIC